jgi:hypothetical protein
MNAYPPVPAVLQSGMVTPGHLATWETNGVIGDGGASSAPSGLNSVATGLIGTGTTQGTATLLQAIVNVATTVPANSGFVLPVVAIGGGLLATGTKVQFFNRGANVASLYPGVGFQIETEGVNNPVGVAANGQSTFTLVTATQWLVS